MVKKTVEIETRVTGDQQAKSKLGSLGAFIKSKLVITLGDVQRVLGYVVSGFKALAKEAIDGETELNQLNSAMKNAGIYSKQASNEMLEMADSIAKSLKIDDGQITNVQSLLIAIGGLGGKDVHDATLAIADLSQRLGMDLEQAGQLVAKTIGTSTNALARQGVEVEGAVGSHERLQSVLDGIAKIAGGSAQEATTTLAKKLDGAKQSADRLKGELGEGLTPVLGFLADAITDVNDGLTDMIKKDTFEQGLIDKANELRIELGWGTKQWEDYDTTVKLIGGTHATISESTENLTKEQKKQREEQGKQIAQLAIYEQAIIKAKKMEEEQALLDKKQLEEANKKKQAEEKRLKLQNDTLALKRQEIDELKAINQLSIDEEIAKNEALLEIAKGNAEEQAKITSTIYNLRISKKKEEYEKEKTINEAIAESYKKMIDDKVSADIELSDALAGGFETTLNYYKKMLTAQIDAWMATEIAKNFYNPFMVAGIVGAGAVGKAGINAVKFAQGGQFETNQATSFNTTSGQTAQVGEKGLERITVEPIGKSQPSGGTMNVTINLGGQELKKVAIALSPYMNAVNKGVI
jgi:hypothetical protein